MELGAACSVSQRTTTRTYAEAHTLMRSGPLILALALAQGVAAQGIARVERDVNLRRDPSTARPPLRLLLPTDELELLAPAAVNDFYHVVHVESGDTGWVWTRNVQIEGGPAISALLVSAG